MGKAKRGSKEQGAATEMVAKRPSREILRQELHEGVESMHVSNSALFISAVSAGLDIGFSPLLVAVMTTQVTGILSKPVAEILAANMYSIGFIFVVLGRGELFTEQTALAVLPVLNRDESPWTLLRLWSIVYLANLIGGVGFAAITAWVGPGLGIITPDVLGRIARAEIDHSNATLLMSAILAGWLMGLLSWLVAASRDTISQLLVVWLITWVIGFAHLHHVIAGSVQLFMAEAAGSGVGFAEIARFLVWATLGNILGGSIFVGLIKYGQIAWDQPMESDRQ